MGPKILKAPVVGNQAPAQSAGAREKRRAGKRTKMLFKVGIVEHQACRGFCLVKEMSNEGLRIVHNMAIETGGKIAVTLGDTIILQGEVRWSEGRTSGVQLDQVIDCSQLLVHLSIERRSSFTRALRLETDMSAIVVSRIGRQEMIVRDISQQGLKVEHDGSFQEGMLVHVILADGHERPAIARWSKGYFAGLMLLNPFHPHELLSLKAVQHD